MKAVLQLYPSDVVLIEDKPPIVQLYVLVTSVSPLRVYRHSEGRILFAGREQVCVHYMQFTVPDKFVVGNSVNFLLAFCDMGH